MRDLRIATVISTLLALGACSGTTNPLQNLINGEPIIDDTVWLLSASGNQSTDATKSNYLPTECAGTPKSINDCIVAMRNVIDLRYRHWTRSLNASVSAGNSAADIANIGLGTAGGLVGGTTAQVLSATIAAVTGTKKALENDVFYNNAVPVVILQMEKDRACWGAIIQSRLNSAKGYRSVQEGFSDLMAYSQAGSFTHALLGLQQNTGAQATANQVALQAAKSAPANAGNGAANQGDAASTTANQVRTCGATPPPSTT